MITRARLIDYVTDARRRTCQLVADLTDEQLIVPRLPIVNPLLWEIGHLAWFQEKWLLRDGGRAPSMRRDADDLYDSATVLPETRWDLPLPSRAETQRYLDETRDRVVERLQRRELQADDVYFTLLTVFHEDMHTEALTYMRQTLGYAAPRFEPSLPVPAGGPWEGDVDIPAGEFLLGSGADAPFVFDNEREAHRVQVGPFRMARAPVTQREFAEFVDAGGYQQSRFWSAEAWDWRTAEDARYPVYWRREGAREWLRRNFDCWLPLEPYRPVVHVSWYEAEAYCRWAGRRLPSEAEWEYAAAGAPLSPVSEKRGGQPAAKRPFPWGEAPPTPARANLDWAGMGCVDVAALPAGDSAWGCRQMLGNVWEWTASDFLPYPGFVAGPYKEYSAPWFGTRKVLRGGCWATRGRLIQPAYRNYFRAGRRDVFAGFRTCAV